MLGYLTFETPIGWLLVAESPLGIALVDFMGRVRPSDDNIDSVLKKFSGKVSGPGAESGLCVKAKEHILEYFENRTPLPPIPVDLSCGTSFDQSIWKAIGEIGFGQTRSYTQIAEAAGNPRAVRAAGRACGRNPVPVIIPCHRVVTSDGKLGGFSGGLDIKRALLDLEKTGKC